MNNSYINNKNKLIEKLLKALKNDGISNNDIDAIKAAYYLNSKKNGHNELILFASNSVNGDIVTVAKTITHSSYVTYRLACDNIITIMVGSKPLYIYKDIKNKDIQSYVSGHTTVTFLKKNEFNMAYKKIDVSKDNSLVFYSEKCDEQKLLDIFKQDDFVNNDTKQYCIFDIAYEIVYYNKWLERCQNGGDLSEDIFVEIENQMLESEVLKVLLEHELFLGILNIKPINEVFINGKNNEL